MSDTAMQDDCRQCNRLIRSGQMKKYPSSASIIDGLFDEATHQEIIRFMDEFLPLTPLASDAPDPETPLKFKRRYAHNLPFFVNIHHQLKGLASEIFGKAVKPSYCFLSLYEAGGQCPLHIDRPQCRYTIDYLIRQESVAPWEIRISNAMSDAERDSIKDTFPSTQEDIKRIVDSMNWTSAMLQPNDAVCYSGTNSWHYRPQKSSGTADLVFWHFVPEDFNGPLA